MDPLGLVTRARAHRHRLDHGPRGRLRALAGAYMRYWLTSMSKRFLTIAPT